MNNYRVCAWCQTVMSEDNGALLTGTNSEVTHGICEKCLNQFIRKEVTLEAILEKIPYPVLIISDELRVLATNSRGNEILGKPKQEIIGKLGGDAISCKNATINGGCGTTPSCSSCILRNTVRDCFETGLVKLSVNGNKNLELNESPGPYNLRFSVEMLDDVALLHIHKFDKINRIKSASAGK